MQDELLPTKAVAELLGRSVATINRWAQERLLEPAIEMEGTTGARLFRRSDVDAFAAAELERRSKHGACPNCAQTTWHGKDACPTEKAS